MNSHEVFIHIHQGCFAGTGAIVRLPQCQWSKPDGYGKISQCITTTKHSKAKTVCIFLGIYCRNGEHPRVCPSVRPSVWGFQPSSGKVLTHLLSNFVCTFLWLSVQNWIAFGRRWPKFGPLVAKKWLKIGKNRGFRPLSKNNSHNPIQTFLVHLLGEYSEMIRFWVTLTQFWPSSGQQISYSGLPQNDWKWWFPTIIWKKYSCNHVQIRCVHLLGVCSELIHFWATLAKLLPPSGHKIFKMYSRNPFQTSCVHSLGECSELICFGLCWPNVSPLVAKKTLEMVVSDHYLKKYHYMEQWLLDLFQTWCSHLLEGSSQMIQFLPHRPNLDPLVAISVFPFPLIKPQAGTCILWCLLSVHRIAEIS